ncbi:TIGR03546 family protein [Candidatus Bipolaricaulota bacterium]
MKPSVLLPTPLAWLKKILAILKSNLSPNQIGFAFALGVFAGLPPIGLHVLIPVTLALLLRGSFRAFLISMGVFKLISLAVAPASYAIGKWLLDSQRGLDTFWRWLFHLPVIAPMGYSRYLLFGSLVLALAFAVPVFLLIRLLVLRYRDSFAKWVSGWRVSQWLKGKRGTGLARRFLAGGATKYEVKQPPHGVFRFIRREMLIGLPVLYAVGYLIAAIIIPFFAGTLVTSTASWVVGSEVAVSESAFNLFTGGLTLKGFTIQDPEVVTENLVAIPELKVDVGIVPLLSKRMVFNSVVIADAELHVKREADGTLNIDNTSSGWNADGYLEWAAQYADKVDWLGLLRHLMDYLGQWRPLAPREDTYAAYGGGRSFPDFRAPFAIQRLEIGQILITLEDETSSRNESPLPPISVFEIEVSNLALPAALRAKPIRLSLRGQWGDDSESGFQLSATFEQSESGIVSSYNFALRRMDLPRLAHFYATTLPVQITSGLASISGSLRLEGESATGTMSFLLEEFEIDTTTEHTLFGLPAGTSARVIEGINRYADEVPVVFGSTIEGSAADPKLAWEAQLLEIAREGLMMAGKRELNRTIEELGLRIDTLGGFDAGSLDPSFQLVQRQAESAAHAVIENAAGGLLESLPVVGDWVGDAAENGSDDADEPGLSDLLRNLLDPSPANEDTDSGEGSSD